MKKISPLKQPGAEISVIGRKELCIPHEPIKRNHITHFLLSKWSHQQLGIHVLPIPRSQKVGLQ
jgi:hypothetical protein